jgi:hypothetical protein
MSFAGLQHVSLEGRIFVSGHLASVSLQGYPLLHEQSISEVYSLSRGRLVGDEISRICFAG